jgi:extradiol dioxygenase family protein
MLRPFHLALPCRDIEETEHFYCDKLGCLVGRRDVTWIDLDLFGHQLVFHLCGGDVLPQYFNPVDRHQVPLPHFGIILTPHQFDQLVSKFGAATEYVIAPDVRFAGTVGEQKTLFVEDPNGYALEFKSFQDDRFIFEPFRE